MYWLKACTRCGGDLHEEQDHYGEYVACIQCGDVLSEEREHVLRASGILRPEMASPMPKAA